MIFKKSNREDIDSILKITNQAQEYFKSNNINQWKKGYPSRKDILRDIENESSYILIDGKEIIGTTALYLNGEPTYNKIYNGNWLTSSKSPYGVIHRMAIRNDQKGKGLAQLICKYTEEICLKNSIYSIRIDTNKNNKPMQRLIEKVGYKYCGNILLENGVKNYAYEKTLS